MPQCTVRQELVDDSSRQLAPQKGRGDASLHGTCMVFTDSQQHSGVADLPPVLSGSLLM